MLIDELSTPAAIIDVDAFESVLATMSAVHPASRLRPHVKAHKSTVIVGKIISVHPTHAVANIELKALGMDHGNPTMVAGDVWYFSDEVLERWAIDLRGWD